MDIKLYLQQQSILDNIIELNYEKRTGQQLDKKQQLTDLILALSTEVGEFANTQRTFKFWSSKGMDAEEKQLDEFIDIFFFLLSIANLKGWTDRTIAEAYQRKYAENVRRQKNNY
jgi:dimeric dUTPase (all-alpha-NTP-PPase superfamily)